MPRVQPVKLCHHKVLMCVRCLKCEGGGNGRYGLHDSDGKLTRPEYDRLRSAFLTWATAEGYSAGSDEGGSSAPSITVSLDTTGADAPPTAAERDQSAP